MKKNVFAAIFMATVMMILSACGEAVNNVGYRPTATPVPKVVSYEKAVYTVKRGSIVAKQEMRGEIVPARQDDLFFKSPGFVMRVTVRVGDQVKKGDVLAELQVDDLLNQLKQAQIDLEGAQADLEKNKLQHEHDLEAAQIDVTIWEKRVEQAKLRLVNTYGDTQKQAQLDLEITQENQKLAEANLKTLNESSMAYLEQGIKRNQLVVERLQGLIAERQIIAPYDGVVIQTYVTPGREFEAFREAISVGDPSKLVISTQFGGNLGSMVDDKTEAVMFPSLDHKTSYKVQFLPNFQTTAVASANTNTTTTGTTDTTTTDPNSIELSTSKLNIAGVSNTLFYFSIPQNVPADQAKVGRAVDVQVILGKKDNVLLLPPAAIREYKGRHFVVVEDGNQRRRVEINSIGLQTADFSEVNADLKVGEKVLGP